MKGQIKHQVETEGVTLRFAYRKTEKIFKEGSKYFLFVKQQSGVQTLFFHHQFSYSNEQTAPTSEK